MQDQDKTKTQLIDELNEMRRKVAELETTQACAMDAENDLLKSRQEWEDIFQAIGHPTIIMDKEHRILAANKATIEATGKSPEELLNARCYEIFHNGCEAPQGCPMETLLKSGSIEPVEMEMEAFGGHFLVSCTPILDKDGTIEKIIHIATDITERKRAEDDVRRNEACLVRIVDILHYKADSVQDFLDKALSEAIELTQSKIGYIYHYHEDTKEFVLNTWSKDVMKECSIANPPAVYQLEKTGIWGEAVRQRQPILVNDFQAPHPLKKGYPEGHAPLHRYLTVPVFIGDRIVAVVGVANKESDYSQTDILQLTLLMDSVWKVVDRLKAEEKIRESEERFSKSFKNNPAFLTITHWGTYKVLEVNDAWTRAFGYTREEAIGRTVAELGIYDEATYRNIVEEAEAKGSVREIEVNIRNRTGKDKAFLISREIIEIMAEPYLLAMGIDITERKRAEELLSVTVERYHAILSSMHDGMMLVSKEGRVEFVNQAFCDLFDMDSPPEELQGITPPEMIQRIQHIFAEPEEATNRIQTLVAQGRPAEAEEITLKGSRTYIRDFIPIFIDGERYGRLWLHHDITKRKLAEEELRRNEFRFSRAELIARLGNWEVDLSTKRVTASNGARRIYGVGQQELTLEDIQKFTLPEFRSPLDAALLGLIKDGASYDIEFQIKRADDDQVVDVHSIAHYDAEKNTVYGTIHDVTDLRLVEESHKLLFEAMEHSAEAIIITDSKGIIQYVNPAQEIISGYSRNELLGQTPNIFKSDLQDDIFYDKLWEIINSGKVWSGRFVNRKKDGTVYHEDATISPVYSKTGKLTNFVAVKHNITERLKLSEQLFQAQKMEAVGTLAGGVAHDFNNILQAVLGYSELMLTRKKEGERDYADLRKIYQAGKRGAELVKSLLTFSRKVETKFVPVDLNHEITSVRDLLSRTIPKTINIDLHLEENLKSIKADRSQVGQVLMNLGVNARDAMSDGGILTIETANIQLDEEYCSIHHESKPGSYVLLAVTDTGQGMDKETLSHIFEPFFTTKETGKGTGLGLATVYGIVKQHGGQITCYSEPGLGTTFQIYLPAIQTEQDLEATTFETAIPGGTETILLVDDDDDIRDLGATLLIEFGYKVIMAVNGKEALEIYLREKDRISLILLDLIMPEMDGRQCLAEILRVDRNAKVIIASGYSQNGPANGVTVTGAKGFVQKPYNMRQLLTTIREVLDKN
ncbi:MAG: PAS domain S-box protein [Desulfomonilaceae bacterium]